ncbi:hypothetical protein M408DRAFT_248797 [Serendipita vermifera MAFF 305830]|uniref:Uncharacterized protein n=1 Tax=Serendipita vermifera MAFF 305830 TaxID=933852 RepID=A0A0C3AV49_SERVB|nr:hypothetical protein M408DRAFT_248797 [Serendipita vermifera MAFF 305830]
MSTISISDMSLATPIRLPNELLSHIVFEALLSSRLNSTTDELFIQPKCRMAFQSLCNGFGSACRKYRAVLLREWFRVFHVQELEDLETIINRNSGIIKSVFVAEFIRELHFHQSLILLPSHFTSLKNLHTISYPLQRTRVTTGTSRSSNTNLSDSGIPYFPAVLQKLELREADTCSPDELRSINLRSLTSLTDLRVACGGDGAWGPVPYYNSPRLPRQVSSERPSRGQKLAHLIESYLDVLSPLKRLKRLSLDVHFTDATVFPPEHSPPGHLPPNPHLALLAQQQQQLAFFQTLLLLNPGFIPPAPAAPAQPATPTEPACTGDNYCATCWKARVNGTYRRELLAAKILARGLRSLETVEWTIWFKEKGTGERRRRVYIDRSTPLSKNCEETNLVEVEYLNAIPDTPGDGSTEEAESDDTEESETEDDILLKEANAVDFVCRTTKVPLALYPAVLG